jgi:hypothetical protein
MNVQRKVIGIRRGTSDTLHTPWAFAELECHHLAAFDELMPMATLWLLRVECTQCGDVEAQKETTTMA